MKQLFRRIFAKTHSDHKAGDSPDEPRSTDLEILEPRMLFSAAPVEAADAEQAAADSADAEQAAEESVVVSAQGAQAAAAAVTETESTQEGLVALPTGSGQSGVSLNQGVTLLDVNPEASTLNQETLDAVAEAAAERWRATGLTADQEAALDAIDYQVGSLANFVLGEASGHSITVDDNAGGRGWFIDSTPLVDEEFTLGADGILTSTLGDAGSGHDLLTVLLHEQGHILGIEDQAANLDPADVMSGTIGAGLRRLPGEDQADGALPGSIEDTHFAISTLGTPASVAAEQTPSMSYTLADGDDRLLVVMILDEGGYGVTDVSFGSTPLTMLGEVAGSNFQILQVWYKEMGDSLTSTTDTITATFTDNQPNDDYAGVIAAVAYEGVNQATPVEGFVSSDGVLSTSVTSEVGDLVVGAAYNFGGDLTAGPGQTAIHTHTMIDVSPGSGEANFMTSSEAGAASVAMSYTAPSVDDAVTMAFNINSDAPPSLDPEIKIEHTPTTVEIPDGDTTPTGAGDEGTYFDSVDTATGMVTRTFTITNTGNADLTLTGATPVSVDDNTHFSVTQPATTTLTPTGPNQSTTFTVKFNPNADGLQSTTVRVASDDGDEADYDFKVEGIGTTLSPTNITQLGSVGSISNGGNPFGQTDTLTLPFTVEAGANRLLVVFGHEKETAADAEITGVTFQSTGGSPTAFPLTGLNLDIEAVDGAGLQQTEIYHLALGSGGQITGEIVMSINDVSGDNDATMLTAVAYENVDQATPVDGFVSTNGSASNSALNVVSEAGDRVVSVHANRAVGPATADPMVDAAQTVIHNLDAVKGSYLVTSTEPGGVLIDTLHSWNSAPEPNQDFVTVAMNINAAPPAPDTTTVTIDGSGNLVIEDTDTTIDNQYELTSDGTTLTIKDNSGAANTIDLGIVPGGGDGSDEVTVAFGATDGVNTWTGGIIVNGAGGDDDLEINYGASSGTDFNTRTIDYNGQTDGGAPGDSLTLTGGTFTTAEFGYDNANDGDIQLNGQGLISYTGLEPITSTITAADVTLNYDGGAETITVAFASGTSINVNSTKGESTTFANPTGSLTINAGSGDDIINLEGLNLGWGADLNINGDGGTDSLVVANASTVNLQSGSLTVDVDTVSVSSSLSSAANISLTGTSGVTFAAGSFDLTANTGIIAIDAGTGTLDYQNNGNFTADGVELRGTDITIAGSSSITADNNVLAGNTLAVDILATNAFQITGSTISASGTDRNVSIGGATVQTGAGVSASGNLTVNGTSGVTVTGGDLRADSDSDVSGDLVINSGTGLLEVQALAGTLQGAGVEMRGADISLQGSSAVTATSNTRAGNTLAVDILAVNTVQAGGAGITTSGAGESNISIGGGTTVLFNGLGPTSTGDVTVTAGTGVTVNLGAGFFVQKTVSIDSGTGLLDIAADLFVKSVALTADTIDFKPGTNIFPLVPGGTVTIAPTTPGTTIGLGGGTGGLNLTDTELGTIQDGFSAITIGNSNAGTVEVATATFTDPLTLRSGALIQDRLISPDLVAPSVIFDGDVALQAPASIGPFDVTGNVTLLTGNEFQVEIFGGLPAIFVPPNNDALNATGDVSLGGATLDIALLPAPTVGAGDVFTIVTSGGTLSGLFKDSGGTDIVDGQTLTVGATELTIDYDYTAGTVTLTESAVTTTTDVSVSGGILTIGDVDGVDNDFLITTNGTTLTIEDRNDHAIDLGGLTGGGDGTDTVTLNFADNGWTGALIVNGSDGDDNLTIDFGSTAPSADFDTRAITFNGNGNTGVGDELFLTGGSFATATFSYDSENDGDIQLTGQGLITYTGLEPVTSSITAADVILTYTSALAETITVTDNGGDITVDSDAGGESTNFTQPTNSLTINAAANDTVEFANALDFSADLTVNVGIVNVLAAGSIHTSGTGTVTLNGGNSVTISADVTAAGSGNIEVDAARFILVNNNATVSTGTGSIDFDANTGGTGTGAFTGILVTGGADVTSTSGAIGFTGIAGTGGGHGVHVDSGSNVTTGGVGTLTLSGTGKNSADRDGVLVKGKVAAEDGALTVTGIGNDGGEGVQIENGGVIESVGSGNIDITATKGATSVADFVLQGALGDTLGTGTITINADVYGSTYGGAPVLDGSGALVIKPRTDSTTIGVGAGASGTLNIDDTEIGHFSDGFTSIAIGAQLSGTGAVDVNSSTFLDNITISGGSISVTELDAGANDVSLNARFTDITNGGDVGTDVTGAHVSLLGTGGIGADGDQISLAADTLELSSVGTDAYLSEADTVTLANTSIVNGTVEFQGGGTFELPAGDMFFATELRISNGSTLEFQTPDFTFGPIPITVENGGTLSGVGATTEAVTVEPGGTLAPGLSPGVIFSGNLDIDGDYDVEVVGFDGAGNVNGHDQTVVTGTVDLDGTTSTLTLDITGLTAAEMNANAGAELVIIDNDHGSDAVIGDFSNFAEGEIVSANIDGTLHDLVITYRGGTGNDVSLIAGNLTTRIFSSGNDLIIEDINDVTNDQLTVSVNGAGTHLIVTEADTDILIDAQGAFDGATGDLSNSVTIALNTFTGNVILRTVGGDDTMVFENLDLTGTQGLTVEDGAGTDTVTFQTADSDLNNGAVSVTADDVTVDAAVNSGGGAVSLLSTAGIDINAAVTSGGGDITLTADSDNTNDGTADIGAAVTAAGGNIDIDGSHATEDGVIIADDVTTTGAGTIDITGTGGGGDFGVLVSGADAEVSSAGGAIAITGISTGDDGVFISQADVKNTGAGNVTITGTGGSGSFAVGVLVGGISAEVSSAGGSIAITGTSTGDDGVFIALADVKNTGAGNVTITGTGTNDFGVYVVGSSAEVSSAGGAIAISGTSTGDDGVFISFADVKNTGAGNVTITGTGGSGSGDFGVLVSGAEVSSAGGAIAISGSSGGDDGVRIDDAPVTTTGAGTITLIGTGGTDAGSTSTAGSDGVQISSDDALIQTENGLITITGTANANGRSGVRIDDDGSGGDSRVIATGTGGITISGTGGSGNNDIGVVVSGASAEVSSAGGAIAITGTSTGDDGVFISLADVKNTGAGNVTITGTGGSGSNDFGVLVTGFSAEVSSAGGAIAITGTSTGDNGVIITQADVKNTGAGNVTITGTGGSGSGDYGVLVSGSSAEVSSAGGNISITGDAATNGGDDGVQIDDATVKTSGNGTLTIIGTGGNAVPGGATNADFGNDGVQILGDDAVVETQNGLLTIEGTAGANIRQNRGVLIGDNSAPSGSPTVKTIGSGAIEIAGTTSGTGSNGVGDYGVHLFGSGVEVSTAGAGSITIDGDSAGDDGVQVNGGDVRSYGAGDISITGTGGGGNGDFGIFLNNSLTEIASLGGNIALSATSVGYTGLFIDDAQVTTTANGTIDLDGSGPGGGIHIRNNSARVQTENGLLTLDGSGTGAGVMGILINDQTDDGAGPQILSTTGNIELTGTGGSGDGAHGIRFQSSAGKIQSTSGNISLTGDAATNGGDDGVLIDDATVKTSDAGTITIVGTGGTDAGSVPTAGSDGVQISSDQALIQTENGLITITGTANANGRSGVRIDDDGSGGDSRVIATGTGGITITGTGGSGFGDYGVLVSGASAEVSSAGGAIAISGTSTGDDGVFISQADVKNTGAGNVTITGTGGSGSFAVGVLVFGISAEVSSAGGVIAITGTSTGDYGVFVNGSLAKVSSAGGAIAITGSSTGDDGVLITAATVENSGAGDVTIIGTGGTGDYGVNIQVDGTVTVADGDLTVTGTGGAGANGVRLSDSSGGRLIADGSGSITITATSGGGGAADFRAGSDSVIGDGTAVGASTAASGNITINADSIEWDGTQMTVKSTGDLLITPRTASTTIGIGDTATGDLNLNPTEIGFLQDGFSSITIGDSSNGTGAVDVNDSTFLDDVTIVGGTIAVTELDAGSNDATLIARTGAITDGGDAGSGNDVTAAGVTLNAAGDIGSDTAGDEIALSADSITTDTSGTNSAQFLSEADSVDIASFDAGTGIITLQEGGEFDLGTNTVADGSFVEVEDGATLDVNGATDTIAGVTVNDGGTLKGDGTIDGPVTVNDGGTGTPGNTPGVIATGNLTLNTGSTFFVELDGTAGAGLVNGHDQYDVTGTVTIDDATLSLDTIPIGYTPSAGDQFVIINNDGVDAVMTGTFAGLAEGTYVSTDDGGGLPDHLFQITYLGTTGTGNDVVLEATGETATTNVYLDGGGNLVVEDIDGANTNDNIRVSLVGTDYVIEDLDGNPLGTLIVGATQTGFSRIEVPVGLVTGIDVNTLGGDDTVTIGDLGTLATNGNLSVDGGDDQDSIFQTGDVTLTGTGAVDYTAERIAMLGGSSLTTASGNVDLNGTGATGSAVGVRLRGADITSTSGNVDITGQGGTTGIYNRGILLEIDLLSKTASTISAGGSVTLNGTGGGAGVHATGVTLVGATVESTGTGPVTITGTGGTGSVFSEGVAIHKGSTVDAGTGNLFIDGTGGSTGTLNRGINASNSEFQSDGGNIEIDGTAKGTVFGIGVDLTAVDVTTNSVGTVTIRGTGASGTVGNMGVRLTRGTVNAVDGAVQILGTGNGSAALNHGLQLSIGFEVNATGNGAVTVKGTGGAGTSLNHGIQMATGTGINVFNGDLTVTGTARGTMTLNRGVDMSASNLTATGTGNILLTGTGSASGAFVYNTGIAMIGGGITTNSGNMTLNGVGGTGTSLNEGIRIVGATLQSTANGTLSLTGVADSGTSGVYNTGVYLLSMTLDSSGTIGVIGTGGGGTLLNHGIYMQNITTPNSTPGTNGDNGAGNLSEDEAGNFFIP